jgi:glutamate/tyrosine decarboxylase-like PLP-dependent enzyme
MAGPRRHHLVTRHSALRDAFASVVGIDGAEVPGEDVLLPVGPRVFKSSTLARVARTAERLWPLFDAVVRRELTSQGASGLARSLGFERHEIDLIASTPSILSPPVRADFVPTRVGYRLVEWNVDPCLGGLAGQVVFDSFAKAGAARGLFYRDPSSALVPMFARLRGNVQGVLVLIREVDLPKWRLNAQRFVEIAVEAGLDARIVALEQLFQNLSTSAELPWGVVRFFHIGHVSEAHSEIARLLDAVRAEKIQLLYGFDTELWGDKQWFASVPDAARLNGDLRQFVPETRIPRDIEAALLTQKEKWILKPHAGAAGEGVLIGREQNKSDWRMAVERAAKGPGWVAQKLLTPLPTRPAYFDSRTGRVMRRQEVETLGIFLVEGKYAGAYVRSIPVAKGLVVDSTSNFNIVVTRERTSHSTAHVSRSVGLSETIRQLWLTPSPSALKRRLRAFEGLAVQHLVKGGGTMAATGPRQASHGFRRAHLPKKGEAIAGITHELRESLLRFCHDKRDPMYAAQLDIPPADLSIATGVLMRALAQDPVTWTSSRAGTFMEQEILRWLAGLAFANVLQAGGIACAGGTQANLHAMLLARNLALPEAAQLGMAEALRKSGARSLKVIASSATHGSVAAAVRHSGIGDQSLSLLPTNNSDALRLDALEEALATADREGDKVALVVLNAGTVGVGAIDPLPQAIAVAKAQGARVHVDAAHGAMLLFSRLYASRLTGIELADSIAADPHKILGLNQGLGALLLREYGDAEAVAKDPAPYFASAPDIPSFARFTLDGTRPLHALGAWILMRHLGRSGYEKIVDHLFALTERFVAGLDRLKQYELYTRPAMNLVAFRKTTSRSTAIAGRRRGAYAAAASNHFSYYQSPRGEFMRAVFVNPATTEKEIDGLLATLAHD